MVATPLTVAAEISAIPALNPTRTRNQQRPRDQRDLLGEEHQAEGSGALMCGHMTAPLHSHRHGYGGQHQAGQRAEQNHHPGSSASPCDEDNSDERDGVDRPANEHHRPGPMPIDEPSLYRPRDGGSHPEGRTDGAGHNQRSGGPTHHKDKTERCGALCELRKQTEERLTGDVGRAQKHHVETAPARRCLMS